MYHYRESGLSNVYLMNGYREVETAHGRGIAIEDVETLHAAIAYTLVEEKPFFSGPEVRFVRKLLELTQSELATLLGVEDQSVRRWEKLGRVPKQADHGIRLVFRDMTHKATTPLPQLVQRIEATDSQEVQTIRYRFLPRSKERWRPLPARAAA